MLTVLNGKPLRTNATIGKEITTAEVDKFDKLKL